VTAPVNQLLVYGFAPDADFEGQLVGALERIESGGALRILDALFVGRDPETAELVAVDLAGEGAGGRVASLLGFRLDPAERRRTTQRVLSAESGGVPGETLRELGEALEPGAAVAAVLVEHAWARALQEGVSRMGGRPLASEFVDAKGMAELAPRLRAAMSVRRPT
jgi:hypothetical protein